MPIDAWLSGHPYLRGVAAFCRQVETAAVEVVRERVAVPSFEAYREDGLAGVPLLRSTAAAVDLEPGGRGVLALVAKLAETPLPGDRTERARRLHDALKQEADAAKVVPGWLLGREDLASPEPGLLRYLGWVAMTRALRVVVGAFNGWRDEERWMRGECPTCGSPPAMAQLIGEDPGRLRFLICGACATRWRFLRTGCPFCESDARRVAVIAIDGEPRLRIDWCESCRGYLKTCNGPGEEDVLLADWTSLHLDVIARDRGLERRAGSLFDFGMPPPPRSAAS